MKKGIVLNSLQELKNHKETVVVANIPFKIVIGDNMYITKNWIGFYPLLEAQQLLFPVDEKTLLERIIDCASRQIDTAVKKSIKKFETKNIKINFEGGGILTLTNSNDLSNINAIPLYFFRFIDELLDMSEFLGVDIWQTMLYLASRNVKAFHQKRINKRKV